MCGTRRVRARSAYTRSKSTFMDDGASCLCPNQVGLTISRGSRVWSSGIYPLGEGLVGILELAGRFILVVEDEPLVCLDLTERLERVGAMVFAASHLDKALSLADHPDLSAGVLDFDLGNADSTAVCWKLVDPHIPFLFHPRPAYPPFPPCPPTPL